MVSPSVSNWNKYNFMAFALIVYLIKFEHVSLCGSWVPWHQHVRVIHCEGLIDSNVKCVMKELLYLTVLKDSQVSFLKCKQ